MLIHKNPGLGSKCLHELVQIDRYSINIVKLPNLQDDLRVLYY
jgi:hypothetical protein